MNYALVENGIVTNIIYLHPMNAEDFPNAVAMENLPVAIGDEYKSGQFYRNGEIVKEVSTFAEMEDMRSALNELGVTVNG